MVFIKQPTVVQREVGYYRFFFGFSSIFFYSLVVWPWFFLLAQRTMLGGPFKYLEHDRRMHRKFSRTTWKKSFARKTWFWQRFLRPHNPIFRHDFPQKTNFFHVCSHIKCLVLAMTLIFFYQCKELSLGHLLDTLNMVIGCTEKILGGLWSKVFVEKNTFLTDGFEAQPTRSWDPIFKNRVIFRIPSTYNVWC